MNKKYFLFGFVLMCLNFPALAELTIEYKTPPELHHSSHRFMPMQTPPIMVRPKNKLWTPDRYSCYMRQTKKYCIDHKGRALNGQIVVSSSDSVAYETYQSGYQTGETSVYSLSGILLERVFYRKGVKDGESIRYYQNGNVHFLMKYKDGALNGRVEEYDINGALLGKMNYRKGWFKDGFCRNEKGGHTMYERLKGEYNQIMPCGEAW